MIGKVREMDYLWFDMNEEPWLRLCLFVCYVDDDWVYLKLVSEEESNYKAHRRSGELRRFGSDGWEIIPGCFDTLEN